MTIELFIESGFWWLVLILAVKYVAWVFETPEETKRYYQ